MVISVSLCPGNFKVCNWSDILITQKFLNLDKELRPVNEEYWHSFGFNQKSYAIPHTWRFSEDGDIHPFEFFLDENHDESKPNKEFVSRLFEKLKTLGFEKMFGLHRIHRLSDLDGFETTIPKERANITTFISKPPDNDFIDVVWTFTKCEKYDGCERQTPIKCMKHCNQHCKGHKK